MAPRRTPHLPAIERAAPVTVPRPRRSEEQDVPGGAAGPGASPPVRLLPVLVLVVVLLSLLAAVWRLLGADAPSDPEPSSAVTVPTTPAALAPDSSYVQTRVTPSGDLIVREWIRSSEDVVSLQLEAPMPVQAAGREPIRARQVRVVVDGRVAEGLDTIGVGTGFYTFAPARDLYLDYRLVGAVDMTGTVAGRGLARATSLVTTYAPRPVTSTRTVTGASLLAMACTPPGARTAALTRPCGGPDGADWTVRLDDDDADDEVAAVFDLG